MEIKVTDFYVGENGYAITVLQGSPGEVLSGIKNRRPSAASYDMAEWSELIRKHLPLKEYWKKFGLDKKTEIDF